MAIITGGIALASVILGNIIFGILVIIAAGSLSLYINRPPRILKIEVTETGVRRDNIFYPFETLASFWLDLDHPHPKIFFRSHKFFMPLIMVPIGTETDTMKLREFLLSKMREEYHSLPFLERVLEYLGF